MIYVQLTEDEDGRLVLSGPKAAKSKRRIVLSELAIDALREQLKDSNSDYVFTAEGGGPVWKRNFAKRESEPLLEMAGARRITFHELRHTANSLLLAEGVSPNVMADLLGHESTRMTLRVYGHVLAGAQGAAAERLNELVEMRRLELLTPYMRKVAGGKG